MPRGAPSKSALAGQAWTLMFDYLIRSAPERTRNLARRGLTPNDSRALFSLDSHEGRTMRALADSWDCDPSNATWIVDRLEKLGLAERRSVPEDRRVKLVVLTAKGQKTRNALLIAFHTPPPEIVALDRDDLEALHAVLAKLMGEPAEGGEVTPASR
jgi:DNA-binding MarR family transcriptional regulator